MMLHAHLPFVRHPEYPDFLEEDWLYEAITETYIPLLEMMNGLVRDGVDFRLTMSMTPPLVSMLSDDLLQSRYIHHISKLIELTEKELVRTQNDHAFHEAAKMYSRKFNRCLQVFETECARNILTGFRRIQDLGFLEIITCGATHGFLPLMQNNKNAVRAQVQVACQSYERAFGRPPRGIWNGECGYYPGLDTILAGNGIRFFFVDTHGILLADHRPKYGIFAPLYCPTGVAAFGRDVESSKAVWSADEGYPGDYNYREFYRDVGYDLDFDYISPYIHESGLRINTGIKYYKITGKGVTDKQPYSEAAALERAADHAGNFLYNRIKQVEYLAAKMDRKPLIVSPYDAELYGHWWYEGPEFLNFFLRKVHFDQDVLDMVTPSEYLQMYLENQVATPSFSSWGHQGYSEFWLNETNDWIYRHLHKIEERMVELANRYYYNTDPIFERALNQCAREVLLAESSDWAFIMRTNTMVEYAVKRTKDHCARFDDLYTNLKGGHVDLAYLEIIEWKDNLFPGIDFRIYADKEN